MNEKDVKNKISKKKINEAIQKECDLCAATFEAWIETVRLTQDRENNIRDKFDMYCPVCKKKK